MISLRQASGRWSVTDRGLTVFGKRGARHAERDIFLLEPGHRILTADLSQIDAGAVAALSQDHGYLALFRPGVDAHAEIARRVFGDPTRREDAKVLPHGFNYGMGPARIAHIAGSERAACVFLDGMAEQFPRLVEWRRDVAEIAASGQLLDNGFGRRMRPDPDRAPTQGPALMGQGCARDLAMEGLLRLPTEVRPMLPVFIHDEVVLSVPAGLVEDVARCLQHAFTFEWGPPRGRPVPITAEVGQPGPRWGEVYEKDR